MPATVLQFTDLHLYADSGYSKYGVRPEDTFAAVLRQAQTRFPDCQRVVLTGDLAGDESPEAYLRLVSLLGPWRDRCLVLPGNHDDRAALRRAFGVGTGAGAPILFSEPLAGWRLIGLDSLVPGELFGRLDHQQLDWLARELCTHAGEPTILFLHHPPVSVHSPWLDRIGLFEGRPFARVVAAARQVRALVCGHVHQELAGRLAQAAVFAAPSTFLQFRPCCAEHEIDPLPPGYRVLQLEGAGYATHVERVCEPP